MNNFEKIKTMTTDQFAQLLVFDEEGFERSSCTVCASSGNCDDKYYQGVKKYLESEVK